MYALCIILLPMAIEDGKKLKHKEKYLKYLKSRKWKNFSNRVKAQRNHTCEICGVKKIGLHLHAHHLTYERLFNENPFDIQILCSDCHAKEHCITPR